MGSRNQRSARRAIEVSLAGIAPIEVVISSMRAAWDDANDLDLTQDMRDAALAKAQEMAAVALPYTTPRLASTDMTMKSDNVHRVIADKPMTRDEWMAAHATVASEDTTDAS